MSERAKRIICWCLDVRKTSNIHWRNTNVCDAASNKWTLGATGLTSSKLKVCGCFVFLLKRIFKGTSCVGCSLNWSLNPCVWVQCIVNCVTSSRKRLMWSCKHPVAASNAQRDLQTNKTERSRNLSVAVHQNSPLGFGSSQTYRLPEPQASLRQGSPWKTAETVVVDLIQFFKEENYLKKTL